MNRTKFILLAGIMLSCSSHDESPMPGPIEGTDTVYAYIDTKVSLGTPDETTTPVCWSEEDCIMVFNADDNSTGTFSTQSNQSSATFTRTGGEPLHLNCPHHALYPAQLWHMDQTDFIYSLPASQTYQPQTMDRSAFAMQATNLSGSSFNSFHTLLPILKLTIKAPQGSSLGRVTRVVISSKSHQLSGEIPLRMADDGTFRLEPKNNPKPEQRYVSYSIQEENLINDSQSIVCHICIPEATYEEGDLTYSVECENGIIRKKGLRNITFQARNIYRITLSDTPVSIPQGAVDLGLCNNAGTKPLFWAQTNLHLDGNDSTYGDYYAWGETDPYYNMTTDPAGSNVEWKTGKETGYEFHSYTFRDKTKDYFDWGSVKPWNTDSGELRSEYDPASRLGTHWHTPSIEQWRELMSGIPQRDMEENASGYSIQGRPGYAHNELFLPYAASREGTDPPHTALKQISFWSSTFDSETSVKYILGGRSGLEEKTAAPYLGFSIRAVYE